MRIIFVDSSHSCELWDQDILGNVYKILGLGIAKS